MLMTYVLVLTLGMADQRTGFAINSINDFQSEELCLIAGNAWLKHQQLQKNLDFGMTYLRPNAICLPHKVVK